MLGSQNRVAGSTKTLSLLPFGQRTAEGRNADFERSGGKLRTHQRRRSATELHITRTRESDAAICTPAFRI
ncbi:hypothetical protein GCM10011529_29950 [Polymorphobacter glacialis]|uniref:Uncharacterized protein n=1 Tax=Sandarakinorhabdus glacialis TaxID=1614636 RepID=A0A917A1M8_9SPHN|nr:hypothetical protein GCM10011529_29950 [Polymorphobacter glacialis]